MDLTAARDALVGHLNTFMGANHPTVKVFYDNTGPIDLLSAGSPFLVSEIRFDHATQASVDSTAMHRTSGSLFLTIFVKEGTGYRSVLQLADELTLLFKMQNLTGLITRIPTPLRHETHDGWMSQEILVPFWFDSKIL